MERVGQQLRNYLLTRLLGRGRLADVYLGEHLYLHTQMAIKLLHARLTPEAREDFLIEVSQLSHLIHPHIIRVIDFDVDEGIPFLVMDYAPHGTLRERYKTGERAPLSTVVYYVTALASALQYAHEHQQLHRNLKPENVLLGRNEEVLLSDFGINLVTPGTDSLHVREIFNNMPYMSPEQIRGKPQAASDQYALAIMAYEWLTGEQPFRGNVAELYRQHLFASPPSLRKRVPDIPVEVAQVIYKALSKLPGQRFVDIRAFATALAEASGETSYAHLFVAPDAGATLEGETLQEQVAPALPVLPIPLTPLIGREQQAFKVRATLMRSHVRLLTLTGTGGIGKTRLALDVASSMQGEFTHGTYFVPLSAVSDHRRVVSAIIQALDLREAVEEEPFEQLRSFLRNRHVLLVLDNFEQVTEAAPLLSSLLSSCPALKILVTSRAVLHLQGEYEFPVPPLQLPNLQRLPGKEELLQYPAVSLFVQRAQATSPTFQLTDENAPVVAAICVLLEGLPLALELAASRIKLLPPQALLTHLQDHRLQVLASKSKDMPVRQQTLRNTIAWSYDLLTAEEMQLFRRLSVFVNGCTFEALESLYLAFGEKSSAVLDSIASLQDKSLLQQIELSGEEPRLQMSETIRAYGLEQLEACGELARSQRAHAAYYLALVERAEPALLGAQQGAWLDRLERDYDNIRSALEWCFQHQEGDFALRLTGSLGQYWFLRGLLIEGRHQLERALRVSETNAVLLASAARGKVLYTAGWLAFWQSDSRPAAKLLRESLVLFRSLEHKKGMAAALNMLGIIDYNQRGRLDEGIVMLDESLALYRESGEPWGTADVLRTLGIIAHFRGEFERARALFDESLAIFKEVGDSWSIATSLHYLGWLAFIEGSYARARTLAEESVARMRSLGKPRFIEEALTIFACETFAQGDEVAARSLLEEALALSREVESKEDIARALCGLGYLTLRQGKPAEARTLYEEGLLWMKGVGISSRTLWITASCLEGLGEIADAEEQDVRAARLFGAAEKLRLAHGYRNPIGFEPTYYEQTLEIVRAQLGEDLFHAAWQEGMSMTPEEALSASNDAPAPTNIPPQPPMPQGQPAAVELPAGLTKREFEVLLLLTKGLTSSKIAEQLVISPVTVNSYLRTIYSKLGVSSRTGAMRYAIDHKLI